MLRLFVMMAAFTGARRAQLLGLRWQGVSLDVGRVAFTAGWVEGPDGPVLADTKSKRRHSVDLDPGTLSAATARACEVATANGGRVPPAGFVFSDDAGGETAWKPNRATKSFVRARRAAGLRQFRLHDLRHFMATQMLDAGVPLPVVSRRLDHSRISTTLDLYAHAVPGRDALAAAALWDRVTRGRGASMGDGLGLASVSWPCGHASRPA